MSLVFTYQEYRDLVLKIYDLMNSEIENVADPEMQYPKFVIMYEFFRLLRGEAFLDQRDLDSEFQKEMYKMEEALFEKVKQLRDKLPEDSSKAKFYYEKIISLGLQI